MASVSSQYPTRSWPALATTYEGDLPLLLERVADLVEFIEISPDTIATCEGGRPRLRQEILEEYDSVAGRLDFVAHGVGLSIGSHDKWNDSYLELLDGLFERFPIQWHSEHLACTTVDGEDIGTMLAMPRTEEALDLVCERVRRLRERYRVPFLLEHVIRLLPEPRAEMSDAAFLNALTARSGCGLILDAYNLECDRFNYGFDVDGFFRELNFQPVWEVHVAGGVEHQGFRMDVHSRTASETTLAFASRIIQQAPNLRAVTYEFLKEAIPVLQPDGICQELRRIRERILNGNTCAATAGLAGVAEAEAVACCRG